MLGRFAVNFPNRLPGETMKKVETPKGRLLLIQPPTPLASLSTALLVAGSSSGSRPGGICTHADAAPCALPQSLPQHLSLKQPAPTAPGAASRPVAGAAAAPRAVAAPSPATANSVAAGAGHTGKKSASGGGGVQTISTSAAAAKPPTARRSSLAAHAAVVAQPAPPQAPKEVGSNGKRSLDAVAGDGDGAAVNGPPAAAAASSFKAATAAAVGGFTAKAPAAKVSRTSSSPTIRRRSGREIKVVEAPATRPASPASDGPPPSAAPPGAAAPAFDQDAVKQQ